MNIHKLEEMLTCIYIGEGKFEDEREIIIKERKW